MSGTSPPPPTSPQQKNEKAIAGNISNVKEKLINTGKRLKVLTRSKKDGGFKTDENSVLKAKILALEEEISSQNEQMKKKTQEAKLLSNQVKELAQEREGLNVNLEKAEAENEELKNLALKIELDYELEALDKKEEVPDLYSKVEELQGRLDKANKALEDERMEHYLRVQELKSKAHESGRNSAKQLSPNTISPVFMKKIKKLKANFINSKNENQFLKEQIKHKDSIILKSKNLGSILQSLSDDNTEYMDVEIATHSFSNSFNNTARADQLNKINTPPSPRPPRRSSSKSSVYSSNESFLSFGQRNPSTTKSPSVPTPALSPPRAQKPRRTSSTCSKSSSSSAAVRDSLSIPKISTNDSYIIELDACSPTHNSSAPMSPTERVATASALKERPIMSAKGSKAETSSSIISAPTGKAAYRTSGLEPPPSQITMSSSVSKAKPKKPKSKLEKLVNSRNPCKVIDSRPLISNTVAQKRALPPERPVSETSLASRPANERPVTSAATVKPVFSTPSVTITKSPSLALPSIPLRRNVPAFIQTEILRNDESASKKLKMDTRYVDMVKEWVSSKCVVSSDDFNEKTVNGCLEEVKLNYTSMKSPSDPDSKENVPYGIDDSFCIEVPNKMDAKEKAYALLLSLAINKKPELFDHIFSTLYHEFRASLNSKRPDTTCARYSRLLCAISKSTNELERIRGICYDIICHSICPKNAIISLYNISAGWEDVLTIASTDNILMEALRVRCNVIAQDTKTPDNIKDMYKKMARTCKWRDNTENMS